MRWSGVQVPQGPQRIFINMIDTWWKGVGKSKVDCPWGDYTILFENENVKVKQIRINPDSKLSYQYHLKRREVWTVISGELTIILDDEKVFRSYGETIKIPLGSKHRAINETDEIVEFIEVQTGDYFGEDDIVRIDDDFGRV
jgi:mannose-6-phosphate isomerase